MKIFMTKEYGDFLRKVRKSKHYTQSYISEFTGLSVSFISDLENGKKTIELNKAIEYANILGVDLFLEERK